MIRAARLPGFECSRQLRQSRLFLRASIGASSRNRSTDPDARCSGTCPAQGRPNPALRSSPTLPRLPATHQERRIQNQRRWSFVGNRNFTTSLPCQVGSPLALFVMAHDESRGGTADQSLGLPDSEVKRGRSVSIDFRSASLSLLGGRIDE